MDQKIGPIPTDNERLHLIIAIEGLDGTGKESVSKRLKELLKEEGYRVDVVSFPRYDTAVGEVIRQFQMGSYGNPTLTDPYIAGALYTLDRIDFFKPVNIDMLDFLILDRSYFSNFIYQGPKFDLENGGDYGRMRDWMRTSLQAEIKQIPLMENLFKIYFLQVSDEDQQEQMKNRKDLDMNESNRDYQNSIRDFFFLSRSFNFWYGIRNADVRSEAWEGDPEVMELEKWYLRKVEKIQSVHTSDREKIPEAIDATARKILADINKDFNVEELVHRPAEINWTYMKKDKHDDSSEALRSRSPERTYRRSFDRGLR